MVIDFTTAERVVAFLNIARLSFDDAESELTGRLSRLLDQHVVLSFSCPLTADQDSELFVTIDSATLATTVEAVSAQSMGDNDPGFMTRVVYFTEFDEDNIKPKIIARFSEPLHQDHIPLVEGLIRSFISSVLRRQYATMRRHIINAKIDSDDLGSFLYRLFRRHEFHRLLGAEAASVFALDHRSAMLHLRGTTGLAADAHMSDISFHAEDGFNVSSVFRAREPRIDYRGGKELPLGRSAERTTGGQFTKAYWPLQVRRTSSPNATIHAARPCIGVIRLVNRIHVRDGHTPFTWLPVCCLIYAAESLYNVIESFIATDEASFNKDAAFHGAMSIVDTIAKNIDIVRRSIFKDIYPEDRSINRLFHLSPVDGSASTSYPDQIKVILNTAYASARALSFQIDRASIGLQRNTEVWTHKLITDVLIRAFEMIGDMCISHSANEPIIRPSATKLLEAKERPPSVRGSPEALTSVFANLCENSVKYRQPRKPIHIDVGFDIQPSHVEVQFRDYGIGILHGEEERIFTRGYRTPRARDFAVRGNGLGLSWCREVLEHFKGSITAKRHDDGLEVIVRLSRK